MQTPHYDHVPHFVIFEGVDGVGKTTLSRLLASYYRRFVLDVPSTLYFDSFPGAHPGTLGEWVYRYHHGRSLEAPPPESVAAPALQLLHVAAHVDTILNRITPTLAQGGCVILDRYWWSTYAYSRLSLPIAQVQHLVGAERIFWEALERPVAVYLTRAVSLKADELDQSTHAALDTYYDEVVTQERQAGRRVLHLRNDGPIEATWKTLLSELSLPYRSRMDAVQLPLGWQGATLPYAEEAGERA
ncbi:MAG TPA: hypothetical protein VMV29_09885 [Ktedonobacterales bacterium]|nr:hypothetical protein [Ktedonobacterales bacterium]